MWFAQLVYYCIVFKHLYSASSGVNNSEALLFSSYPCKCNGFVMHLRFHIVTSADKSFILYVFLCFSGRSFC